jgi:alpha-L-arabinofuranosidase
MMQLRYSTQMRGVKLRRMGRLSQTIAPSAASKNEVGKEPVIKIANSSISALPDKVQLPPVSVNIYQYQIA